MDILCVGELVADIVVRPVPKIDPTVDSIAVDQISVRCGGGALNCAINLSKMGNSTGFAGIVGEDMFGNFIRSSIRQAGMETNGLTTSKEHETCKAIALVAKDGSRNFLHCRGANDTFSICNINLSQLESCRILHIGGTFHLAAFDGAGGAELLARAKSMGKTTSMDVAWDHSGKWYELIRDYLPNLDYFLPSFGEASKISGCSDVSGMADFFLEKGVKNVLIKLGKDGVFFKNPDRCLRCGTYDITPVDTTGAGDAFVAGFLTGVNRGLAVEKCLELGTAAANINITQVGASGAITSLEQVRDFIKDQPRLQIKSC